MSRKRPFTVRIERGELVFRIGVDTLKIAADTCPLFYNSEKDRSDVIVTDPDVFAKDVITELEHEEEDGSTPLSDVLDKAMSDAVEGGSLGVVLPGDDEHSNARNNEEEVQRGA